MNIFIPGKPVGISPIVLILYTPDKSTYCDTNVPTITAINSIGTGIMLILLIFGFNHSLFVYNMLIETIDINTADQLTSDNLQMIS